MDNDDRPVGRILGRREVLALFGTASMAALVGCATQPAATAVPQLPTEVPTTKPAAAQEAAAATAVIEPTSVATLEPTLAPAESAASTGLPAPACVVSPEMTEGPYFVDEKLNRSDIRANTADGVVKEGVPLELSLRVTSVTGSACAPLAGAVVDIWHCDAAGLYSDVQDRYGSTVGQDFLRGSQVTDASGVVRFTTIYPGWYPGRAVHIHFKVRGANASGQNYEFTSQFFFDDALSEQVFTQAPYASKGSGFQRNAQDGIFRGGGDQTTLAVTPSGAGYASTFDIGIQL